MDSVWKIPLTDLKGQIWSLGEHQGDVLLICNTASECGFTKQYSSLQSLHDRYSDKGLTVIAFPCNQFGGQEPLESKANQVFCEQNFGVTFRINQKIEVNGKSSHQIFEWLKSEAPGILGNKSIKWNFTKFLVDRQGQVFDRYAPITDPLKLEEKIKALLTNNDASS